MDDTELGDRELRIIQTPADTKLDDASIHWWDTDPVIDGVLRERVLVVRRAANTIAIALAAGDLVKKDGALAP